MSVHIVASAQKYNTKNDSNVTLRVLIGEAQGGGWVIAWDSDHVVAKGDTPQVIDIGRGSDVAGRTLQVVATAVDIRSETNRLSSTLTIDGGADGTKEFVSRFDDGSDGDVAIFTTMIGFQ
jgi:hypothetical protein